MKSILVALSLLSANFVFASHSETPSLEISVQKVNNYVMSTGVSGYVPAIIMTAADMKNEEGKAFGDFQIVIYGEAVKQFADPTEGPKLVKMAKEAGAKLVLCEFALKKFGIDKSQLPIGLDYVGNAFKHAINLQKKGYFALGL